MNRLDKEIIKLSDYCKEINYDLKDYLGYKHLNNLSIRFNFKKTNNNIIYKVNFQFNKFKKEAEYIRKNNIGLPFELNNIIANFVEENYYINLDLEQNIPDNYPFEKPIFKLKKCNSNINDYTETIKKLCIKFNKYDNWTAMILSYILFLDFMILLNKNIIINLLSLKTQKYR
uniref:Uncharacterized protein n=1 Tax=viral metagenome TaxID=1070528 RepID=A0A6C0J6V8_9ZZZZ